MNWILKRPRRNSLKVKTLDSICLGTVKLGSPDYGFSSNQDFKTFDPLLFLRQAEAIGIRKFDTSPRYGRSEEIIGEYISFSNKTPIVSTKIDKLKPGVRDTPKMMLESVSSSLRKLNLLQLDTCYLHQNELEIISDPYVHEGLTLIKDKGLSVNIGVSVYSFEECEYAVESGIFDVIQVPISVFDLTFYNRYVLFVNSVRFVARSLLLQGILVNRSNIKSRIRYSAEILECLVQLDRLAEEYNYATLDMALGFVFSLENICHYLIGTASINNLKRNIRCLNIQLPPELCSKIKDIASNVKIWNNPRNW
jgi:aryl-alcohol dehydrogenase-like predicted oxidoreductase